jgi:NADPH-dependent curcumin reductase CurA
MASTNVRVLLEHRPNGSIDPMCFRIDEVPLPELAPAQVMVRNIYLSCDPYLRGRMAGDFPLGQPVTARVVGRVERSLDPAFAEGDIVWGFLRWELYSVVRGAELTKVDPSLGPISHAITVRGMPGLTAYVGMIEIGRPRPGETVVVSAATGAVGSVAGQLARLAGARVVATGGTEEKVRHAVDTLGYHAAINYRSAPSLADALDAQCPGGIDVYFDNVGGELLDAVLPRLNRGARIPLCGMISAYDTRDGHGLRNFISVLTNRVTVTGFAVSEHVHKLPEFVEQMSRWVADGTIVYVEDVVEGIENLPAAFIGMLNGDNIGKRLVHVDEGRLLAAPA